MNRPLLLIAAIGACTLPQVLHAQNIGINANGATPHASAMLDIDVSAVAGPKRGLLTPRMTSTQRAAIPTPAAGLLVFDTTLNGFWYFTGTAWTALWTQANGWGLQGNGGTTPAANFVGTTDNVPLHFRVNNVTAGRIVPADSLAAFGYRAGEASTSGRHNTFIGQLAGRSVTTGSRNTFVGSQAGSAATGNNNVALGALAGSTITTASDNTFAGSGAGLGTTTGGLNTFVGSSAGRTNTTGTENTFLGTSAGISNTTGALNTFVGREAGRLNSTGAFNTFVGYRAGYATTTSQFNTFMGFNAGMANTTGTLNAFLGSVAGGANTTGHSNVFIGGSAGRLNTTGAGNTYVGANAGVNAGHNGAPTFGNSFFGHLAGDSCTGFWNVAVGMLAGYRTNTGERNTYLGYDADGGPAISNATAIGAGARVTTSNSLVLGGTGTGSVHVGIGVTAPSAELEVNGYTKLGSDGPAIRMKRLSGTTATTQGGGVNIPHGVQPSKILSVQLLVEVVANSFWVPAAFSYASVLEDADHLCSYSIQGANIRVLNVPDHSALVLNKPLKVLIVYEE